MLATAIKEKKQACYKGKSCVWLMSTCSLQYAVIKMTSPEVDLFVCKIVALIWSLRLKFPGKKPEG